MESICKEFVHLLIKSAESFCGIFKNLFVKKVFNWLFAFLFKTKEVGYEALFSLCFDWYLTNIYKYKEGFYATGT